MLGDVVHRAFKTALHIGRTMSAEACPDHAAFFCKTGGFTGMALVSLNKSEPGFAFDGIDEKLAVKIGLHRQKICRIVIAENKGCGCVCASPGAIFVYMKNAYVGIF